MGTIWRPTLRCDSAYRDYINSLHDSTVLDKNQIIRLMMFVAAHTNDFKVIISEYKRSDVTEIPAAPWNSWEDALWLNQSYKQKRNGVTSKSIEHERIPLKRNAGGVMSFNLPPL
ncbi:hypothetical protein ACNQFZ_06525 [Schinkia sp. CFF1]